MELFMMEIGWKVDQMELEYVHIQMELSILEVGKMGNLMDLE